MRTKVTLVLLFLNVALFFFIFKFERNWRTERASLEARRRVLGAEAADIRTLTVLNGATTLYSLKRNGEAWQLTNRPQDLQQLRNASHSAREAVTVRPACAA